MAYLRCRFIPLSTERNSCYIIRIETLMSSTFRLLSASGACERSMRFTCIYLLGSIPNPLDISIGNGCAASSAYPYYVKRATGEKTLLQEASINLTEHSTVHKQHFLASIVEETPKVEIYIDILRAMVIHHRSQPINKPPAAMVGGFLYRKKGRSRIRKKRDTR